MFACRPKSQGASCQVLLPFTPGAKPIGSSLPNTGRPQRPPIEAVLVCASKDSRVPVRRLPRESLFMGCGLEILRLGLGSAIGQTFGCPRPAVPRMRPPWIFFRGSASPRPARHPPRPGADATMKPFHPTESATSKKVPPRNLGRHLRPRSADPGCGRERDEACGSRGVARPRATACRQPRGPQNRGHRCVTVDAASRSR